MSGPRRYTLRSSPRPPSKLDLDRALNEAQRKAVESQAPRILILAGAGTGKTRTLTYRVARLIEKGTPPEAIVLVTFTNRAAKEMTARVEGLLEGRAGQLRAGTFHSLGHRALRRYASALGFEPSFGILSRDDQRDLMNAAVADQNIDKKLRRFPSADALITMLSLAINTDKTIAVTLIQRFERFAQLQPEIEQVLHRYTQRKIEMNVMDFDDLLLHWKALLIRQDEIGRALREEVHHVLVDEYQDTNLLQAQIAQLLCDHTKQLCVVGDDAQSIYAFRGARFDNILDFPRASPTEVHQLLLNYRSRKPIIQIANAVIAENALQFPKSLQAHHQGGLPPAQIPAQDAQQEAQFVAQRVLELRDEGVPLSAQAVLYRAHRQAIELQMELSRRDIPYIVRSGKRFFEQAHVKDLLSFLRLLVNPKDELAWRRALMMLPGLGTKLATKAWALVQETQGASYLERLGADHVLDQFPERVQDGLYQLALLLEFLADGRSAVGHRPGEIIRCLLNPQDFDLPEEASILRTHIEMNYAQADNRLEELEQLAEIAAQETDLSGFLAEVALTHEVSGEESAAHAPADEGWLTLSSIHQAKGLEWRGVFIIGVVEGRLPLNTALNEPDGEAEERRLLYVAITRAKEQLYISYPSARKGADREMVLNRPSRFLSTLDPSLIERWQLDPS